MNVGRILPDDGSLVAAEEKQLVLHNGSADRPTELVALYGIALRGEGISRIENSISNKLEQIAMKLVGSRFRHQGDRARGFHSILGGRGTGFDFELLQRIRKRYREVCVVRLDCCDSRHRERSSGRTTIRRRPK